MHRSLFTLVSLSWMLAALLTLTIVWSSTGAQESTPAPEPCAPSVGTVEAELQPAGVSREALTSVPVSTGPITDASDLEIDAVTSIVCIEPNTEVTIAVAGAADTKQISQYFTSTLIVLSGSLDLKLVEGCALRLDGSTCTVTNGTASYRPTDLADRVNPVPITKDGWTTVPPGGVIVLSDVTIMMKTGDSPTRYLSAGVAVEGAGGGACVSGCGRWGPP